MSEASLDMIHILEAFYRGKNAAEKNCKKAKNAIAKDILGPPMDHEDIALIFLPLQGTYLNLKPGVSVILMFCL